MKLLTISVQNRAVSVALVAAICVSASATLISCGSSSEQPTDETTFENAPVKPLTGKELKSIPDSELFEKLFDRIITRFPKEAPDKENLSKLNPGERMIYLTYWLEGEVNNGGFNQFFANLKGICKDETVASYRLIGANSFADSVAAAYDAFKDSVKNYEVIVKRKLESDESDWDKWAQDTATDFEVYDTAFQNAQKQVDQLRVKYIRSHPQEFAEVEPETKKPDPNAGEPK